LAALTVGSGICGALNTVLWTLSYPEIRKEHTIEEVQGHLDMALEVIGSVRFQARSNKAPVKKEGRLNTWPTLGGKYDHFKGCLCKLSSWL
jgi:hypothetical protein